MTVLASEQVMGRMVEVARGVGGETSRRDEARFEQLEERLALRGFGPQRSRGVWYGGLAAAACLLLALGAWWLHAPALTYAVVDGAVVGGSVLGSEHTKIHFSDGSEVSLQRGAEASIEDLNAQGGRVRLTEGQVSVAIVKNAHTRWFVDAGPYVVRVTGTAFDVRWSKAARRFELDLHHGSVVVTGPQIANGFTLRSGQKLVGSPEGRVSVEVPRVAAAGAVPTSSGLAAQNGSSSAGLPLPAVESQLEARRAEASNLHTAWARQVAQGKFQSVIDEVRRRGLEQTLASVSLEDLSALADAARYASSTSIARRALAAQRQRFPRSSAAHEAAFFLGRLAEERGEGALEWYDRYLAESPKGPYASQALGRRMMIVYRQRGQDATQSLAQDYLARFPKGPYASAASKIIGQPAAKNP